MRKIEIIIRTTSNNPVATVEKVVAELIAPENSVEIERNILNFPGLQIHLEYRRVFKNGQEIRLSRYEYGVLSFMAQHPGQLLTKEQIFEAVWHQDSNSCLTAVTNTISRIRQKIEDNKAHPVYIRTVSNLGYQFMPKTFSANNLR